MKENKDVDVLVDELKQSQHEDAVDALNPCPVCGGEAELISQLFSEYYVGCKDCNMQTGIQSKSDEAMEQWNSLVLVDNAADALKELLYFVYTYEGEKSYIAANVKRPALIEINTFELVDNKWMPESTEKVLTREPDWSVAGKIKPSSATHIRSVTARAKQTLTKLEGK